MHEPNYRLYKTSGDHTYSCECGWSVAARTKNEADAQASFHKKTRNK